MDTYPFWKLDGDSDVYILTGYANLTYDGDRVTVGLFKGLRSGLNEARKVTATFEGAAMATLEETEATPGGAAAVAGWRALREEDA